jgi:hypothetical protein
MLNVSPISLCKFQTEAPPVRRARYRGLVKVTLQNVAIAAAFNVDRIAAWFAKRPLAPTRVSRFAALAA